MSQTQEPLSFFELHPLIGASLGTRSGHTAFETRLLANEPWVHHRVLNAVVFPAAGYIDMILRGFAASKQLAPDGVLLEDVQFEHFLVLEDDAPVAVQLGFYCPEGEKEVQLEFSISAFVHGRSTRFCRGKLGFAGGVTELTSLETLQGRMPFKLNIDNYYVEMQQAGLEYGSAFCTLKELARGKPGSREALGRVCVSDLANGAQVAPFFQSILLDGCLQVIYAALQAGAEAGDESTSSALEMALSAQGRRTALIPASIREITIKKHLPECVWSHVTVDENADDGSVKANVRVFDGAGELLVSFTTLRLHQSEGDGGGIDGQRSPGQAELLAALRKAPEEGRLGIVLRVLKSEIEDTIGSEGEGFDSSDALIDLGMDSVLMAVLQERLQETFGFGLPATPELAYESLESLARFLLEKLMDVDHSEASVPEE
jgi:Polyketide synthase dehydratase/Phosphopantetheine attachment site